MHKYLNIELISLDDLQIKASKGTSSVVLTKKEDEQKKYSLIVQNGTSTIFSMTLDESFETIRSGLTGIIISLPKQKNLSCLIKFSTQEDANNFKKHLLSIKSGRSIDENASCQFDERTEESSAVQYFQFYGYLSQQQNMMQDYVRTSTYQRAILDNTIDFTGKVVLDVGAGSGILSFFAAQAGARKVYAVEASSMAQHAKTLVENNRLTDRIQVIAGKIEEITIPEPVDVIISEPMGYMLYNERMLETYLHAKKWLKPNGKMYPTTGDLYVAPFTDEALYMEQVGKANFWYQQSFYGVDLTTLRDLALDEYFKQPIVDNFDVRICLARPIKYSVNFLTANEEDLHEINVPLTFQMTTTAVVHGLAFWFDVSFDGTNSQVWLSTSPTQPLTHWYQVRCLFMKPLTVSQGKTIKGHAILHSNRKQSYDVEIYLEIDGTTITAENTLDLKNPYFRYPNQPVQAPPGQFHESPTEQFWNALPTDQTNAAAAAAGNMHSNQYSQNCNINVNNNTATTTATTVDYDGTSLTNYSTTSHPRFTLPCASSTNNNHSDKSTNSMGNGFLSFTNNSSGNPFTH